MENDVAKLWKEKDIVKKNFAKNEGKRNFTIQSFPNNTFQIDLKKVEEVFISPQGEKPDFIISPIPHTSKYH